MAIRRARGANALAMVPAPAWHGCVVVRRGGGSDFILGRGRFEFLELHLQLVEQLAATFRRGAEPIALHLGDQQLRCATIASAPEARASNSRRAASSAALSALMSSGSVSEVVFT